MTHEEREALRGLCEEANKISRTIDGRDITTVSMSVTVFNALPDTMSKPLRDLISRANRAIPALLDALDEADAENKALFDTHVDHEAAIEENLTADINHLKARAEAAEARAEAWERAMYTSTLGYYGGDSCCYFCKYGPEGTEEQISYTESTTDAGSEAEWDCKLCNGSTINQRGGWQFDQARFTEGGERDG